MKIRSPKAVCTLSLGVFALALTQDGFYLDRVPRNAWAPGWGEFAVGWISLFSGTVAWLGNPLLIASWVALLRNRVGWALGLAVLSLLFMLSFLLNRRIIFNEAGSTAQIAGYGLGYWLWLSSAGVVALGAGWTRQRPPPAPPPDPAGNSPAPGATPATGPSPFRP